MAHGYSYDLARVGAQFYIEYGSSAFGNGYRFVILNIRNYPIAGRPATIAFDGGYFGGDETVSG